MTLFKCGCCKKPFNALDMVVRFRKHKEEIDIMLCRKCDDAYLVYQDILAQIAKRSARGSAGEVSA